MIKESDLDIACDILFTEYKKDVYNYINAPTPNSKLVMSSYVAGKLVEIFRRYDLADNVNIKIEDVESIVKNRYRKFKIRNIL